MKQAFDIITEEIQKLKTKLNTSSEERKSQINDRIKKLNELINDNNKHRTCAVPFIIVAMTKQESYELINESIFEKSNQTKRDDLLRFQKFKQAFNQKNIVNWCSHYSENRESWRPLICSNIDIEEIIFQIIHEINQLNFKRLNLPLFYPQFRATDFFQDDEYKREHAMCELDESGCVFIIDAISLFHPDIRHTLVSSQLFAKQQVAMITLSPIKSIVQYADELIKEEIQLHMELAFARFYTHLDPLYEVGLGDLHLLRRSLFSILPKVPTILQEQRPYPDNPQFGEPSQGIYNMFKGRRGI